MRHTFRTIRPGLPLAGLALFGLVAAGGTALAVQGFGQTSGDEAAIPAESPAGYGAATFDAWRNNDGKMIVRHAASGAAQVLLARPHVASENWSNTPRCEGAAGSTYCTWTAGDAQLQLRISSEIASIPGDHGVTEAVFTAPAGGVAQWPLTTQREADSSQANVDGGHSPWMLEPSAVASSYAEAVLHWTAPYVEATSDPAVFRIISTSSGAALDVTLVQPARSGDGGIWAISRVEQPRPPALSPPNPGKGESGRTVVAAPIESVDVVIAESFPPQYFVQIVAGLPGGCARQEGHEVTRDGATVTISVTNTMPTGDAVCTAIYGTYSVSVNLGSDFVAGQTYTVDVNGTVTTFVA